MRRHIDLTNQRFGQLTALKFLGHGKWECLCDCGTICVAQGGGLRFGSRKSCGCINPRTPHHGMSRTPTHNSWVQMRRRCSDPNHQNYKWYGARGITYDPRWDDFREFLKDMGECPSPEHRIDRKDPDGHYTKDNCHWAVLEGTKRRNTPIVKNGMPLKEYAASIGLKYHTAYARWRAGTLE